MAPGQGWGNGGGGGFLRILGIIYLIKQIRNRRRERRERAAASHTGEHADQDLRTAASRPAGRANARANLNPARVTLAPARAQSGRTFPATALARADRRIRACYLSGA